MEHREEKRILIFNIRRIIKDKGLKQCAVAEKAGFSPRLFSSMLNDKRKIEVNEYMRICDAIGVPLEQFKPRMPDKTKSC